MSGNGAANAANPCLSLRRKAAGSLTLPAVEAVEESGEKPSLERTERSICVFRWVKETMK